MENLEMQMIAENPRVKGIKDKIRYDFNDLIYSFEWNSKESHRLFFKDLYEEMKELENATDSVDRDNKSREKINLKLLTEQRNKLNRQIATLKKATLKN